MIFQNYKTFGNFNSKCLIVMENKGYGAVNMVLEMENPTVLMCLKAYSGCSRKHTLKV